MRRLLPFLCLALAAPAAAQDWTPVSDDAAYGAVQGWMDTEKSGAENWASVQAGFGPQGVFYGENSTGGADNSTVTRVGAWRTGAELKHLESVLTDFAMGSDGADCGKSECTVGMSHAMTHLVLRQAGGKAHIVGIFAVDAMLDATGQAHIDAELRHWRAAIDQRYGMQKPLPPVDMAPANARAIEQARSLNKEALAALKQKKFKAAISTLVRAVHADPQHYLARYNLACAYSLAGQFKASQAILTAFKAAKSCPACQVRVVRAQTDSDFEAQRGAPAFKAIVDGVRVPNVPLKTIAKAVNAVFEGKATNLTAVVDPLRMISVKVSDSLSDDSKTLKIAGRDLVKRLKALGSPLNPMTQMQCKGACCTDLDDALGHNTLFLEKLCLKKGAAGWTTLDRLEITDGN